MYRLQRWTPENSNKARAHRAAGVRKPYISIALSVSGIEWPAWEPNLLAENESELSVDNDSLQLHLQPYQIMTIRLKEKR